MTIRVKGLMAVFLSVAANLHGLGADTYETAAVDISALTRDRTEAGNFGGALRDAWKSFQSSDCKAAAHKFEAVIAQPNSLEADTVQALFGSGLSYWHMRPFSDEAKAQSAFTRIIEEFPEHPSVPWSYLELGKISRRKSADLDYQDLSDENAESRRIFRHILDHYPDSTAVHEAAIRLASTYFFESLKPEAHRGVEILEDHLTKYPENPLEPVMLLRLQLWIFEIQQDYEKSAMYASRLGEMRMSDPQRWGRHFFHIAQTYRLGLNQPEKAKRWYREIIEVTPKSRHLLSAKKILARIKFEQAPGEEADAETNSERDAAVDQNEEEGNR
jgi:outer membrane protein assembly factor BamD (BamD/ComL family)